MRTQRWIQEHFLEESMPQLSLEGEEGGDRGSDEVRTRPEGMAPAAE